MEMWAKAERVPRGGGHSLTCAELPHQRRGHGLLDSLDFWQKLTWCQAVSGSGDHARGSGRSESGGSELEVRYERTELPRTWDRRVLGRPDGQGN